MVGMTSRPERPNPVSFLFPVSEFPVSELFSPSSKKSQHPSFFSGPNSRNTLLSTCSFLRFFQFEAAAAAAARGSEEEERGASVAEE